MDAPALAARLRADVRMHLLRDASVVEDLAARWSERHRVWHGPDHLVSLLNAFTKETDPAERELLQLVAVYHDVIYDPRSGDNEEASAALLLAHAADASHPVVARAAEMIRASSWTQPPADTVTWKFWEADCRPLSCGVSLAERAAYERAVFREYQFAPWPVYRVKRAEFLNGWGRRYPQHAAGVDICLGLLEGLAPRVAVYPGSFHPFHLGHLSIVRQAERLFDKVIIGVAINRQKPGAEVTLDQRCVELQARLRFHEIAAIPGLLTDFIAEHPLPLSVVRGVRDGTDLEAELRYARFLNELRPGTSVVWIGCEAERQHLSSSAIRELESIAAGAGARYVPSNQEIYGLVDADEPR